VSEWIKSEASDPMQLYSHDRSLYTEEREDRDAKTRIKACYRLHSGRRVATVIVAHDGAVSWTVRRRGEPRAWHDAGSVMEAQAEAGAVLEDMPAIGPLEE
jgi:hypothetical protein